MRDIAVEQHSAPKFFRKNRRFVIKKSMLDLENRDYRKYNKQVTDSQTEISHFDEHNFFNEITKKNKIK